MLNDAHLLIFVTTYHTCLTTKRWYCSNFAVK